MLKLNKSVHFNILCIFAVVFVCVYLYYTIVDVRKIAVEVKKNGQDLANVITSFAVLTKEVSELKKKAAAVCSIKVPEITVTDAAAAAHVEEDEEEADMAAAVAEALNADTESVNTDDVKNLLNDMPDDEPEDTPDLKLLSGDELKSQSIELLRSYCKLNGINARGSKDTLIARIQSS